MTSLDEAVLGILDARRGRDHIILWHKTDAARDAVVGEFVDVAGKEGDYVAMTLCLGDFAGLERGLSKKLHNLKDLIDEGNLVMFVSCEFLPRKDGTHTVRVRKCFSELEGKAKDEKRGLRMVGTVPFATLAVGDITDCMELERITQESLRRGRMLCLYDMRMLRNVNRDQMTQVNERHTHVLVEEEGERIALSAKPPKRR